MAVGIRPVTIGLGPSIGVTASPAPLPRPGTRPHRPSTVLGTATPLEGGATRPIVAVALRAVGPTHTRRNEDRPLRPRHTVTGATRLPYARLHVRPPDVAG